MLNKVFMIASLALSVVGTAAGVAQAVDTIKNGDKRAAIAGTAAGQQIGQLLANGQELFYKGHRVSSVDDNGNLFDENGQKLN